MKRLLLALLLVFFCASVSFAQNGLKSTPFTAVVADSKINNIGTAIAFHQLTWNKVGTVSACTIALDSSVDGITWSAGAVIAGQTCTSNGQSTVANVIANYVRMNMTAFTGTGSVTVVWTGYINNPASGGSGTVTQINTTSPITGGPITTTGTIACATCLTSSTGVTSFNSRTGAVVPQSGDYALDQIGNPAAGTTFTYATNQNSDWVLQGTGQFNQKNGCTSTITSIFNTCADAGTGTFGGLPGIAGHYTNDSTTFPWQDVWVNATNTPGDFGAITMFNGSDFEIIGGNSDLSKEATLDLFPASGTARLGGFNGTFASITADGAAQDVSLNAGTSFSMNGSSSGTTKVVSPAVAGTPTLTWPTATGVLGLASICMNVTPVTVSANTASDQLLMACTIPSGYLNASGRGLKIHANGTYTTPGGNLSTLELKAKLCTVSGCGSGTVITPVDITSGANAGGVTTNPWFADFEIVTQSAGASSSYESDGAFGVDLLAAATGVASVYGSDNTAVVGTINNTAGLFLQITIAFSSGSASNVAVERKLTVTPLLTN